MNRESMFNKTPKRTNQGKMSQFHPSPVRFPDISLTNRSLEQSKVIAKLGQSMDAQESLARNRDSIYDLHHQYISQSIGSPSRVHDKNFEHSPLQLLKSNISSFNSILNLDSLQREHDGAFKYDLSLRKYEYQPSIKINIVEDEGDDEPMQTQINTNKNGRHVNRPRIVSIPVPQLIQPSRVQKSKKFIYSQLSSKESDSTFVAIQIKPNLALLRNKGFYELSRAEDILKSSLEKNNQQKKIMIKHLERRNNFEKLDVVKLSKLLLSRSKGKVAQMTEDKSDERRYEYNEQNTPQQSRKFSRQQEMSKLIQIVQSPQKKVKERERDDSQSNLHQFTPIHQHYLKIMKRKMRQKRQKSESKQMDNQPKDRTKSIESL